MIHALLIVAVAIVVMHPMPAVLSAPARNPAHHRVTRTSVVIYVRGTAEEIARQLAECTALCERRGYKIVGVARDLPGGTSGWDEAQRLRRRGEVDRVIMASASAVPDHLESATGALPGPRLRQSAAIQRAMERRRIRPVPRPDGGA